MRFEPDQQTVRTRRHGRAGLLAVVAVVLLAGCGGGTETAGPPPSVDPEDCAKVAGVAPSPDLVNLALVVDNTASAARGALPPAVHEQLTAAQQRAQQQKAPGQVVIVGVDGDGRRPREARRVALDPVGGTSEKARNARAATVACVLRWASEVASQGEGSEVLAAVTYASRLGAEEVLVVSDGVANAGALDVNAALHDDPAQVARRLARETTPLKGVSVVWAGLGDTAEPLPESSRNALRELWAAIFAQAGAKVRFEDRPRAAGEAREGLPPDEVALRVLPAASTCGERFVAPDAVLFRPGSATLRAGSADVLRPVADRLAQDPSLLVTVAGHTAAYQSTTYRQRLSERRAKAVRQALVSLGVDPARVSAVGYGSTRPRVDEFPGGVHDERRAARNRRVEIDLDRKGCAS
ncbi:OmpA family protein [Micromonospora sp. WMMD882]|uniref:OmpA family protein n=1 Tax=Micromonospora sp. WMMD882 TaxID=3015151 RepID=UPI00248B84E1|nr:OmpA family protein [Micromonospora sp. WMMD882]WBB77299.1 OmpA family protein [Micromonospora sp. WMMD882]